MAKDKDTMRCSFCGRTSDEVRKLVAGPNVYICDECVEVCERIIEDELGDIGTEDFKLKELPTPKEIKAHMSLVKMMLKFPLRWQYIITTNVYKQIMW